MREGGKYLLAIGHSLIKWTLWTGTCFLSLPQNQTRLFSGCAAGLQPAA